MKRPYRRPVAVRPSIQTDVWGAIKKGGCRHIARLDANFCCDRLNKFLAGSTGRFTVKMRAPRGDGISGMFNVEWETKEQAHEDSEFAR